MGEPIPPSLFLTDRWPARRVTSALRRRGLTPSAIWTPSPVPEIEWAIAISGLQALAQFHGEINTESNILVLASPSLLRTEEITSFLIKAVSTGLVNVSFIEVPVDCGPLLAKIKNSEGPSIIDRFHVLSPSLHEHAITEMKLTMPDIGKLNYLSLEMNTLPSEPLGEECPYSLVDYLNGALILLQYLTGGTSLKSATGPKVNTEKLSVVSLLEFSDDRGASVPVMIRVMGKGEKKPKGFSVSGNGQCGEITLSWNETKGLWTLHRKVGSQYEYPRTVVAEGFGPAISSLGNSPSRLGLMEVFRVNQWTRYLLDGCGKKLVFEA